MGAPGDFADGVGVTLQHLQGPFRLANIKSADYAVHSACCHNASAILVPIVTKTLRWWEGRLWLAHGDSNGWTVDGNLEDEMIVGASWGA